jgi:hypothetical protein
LKENKAFMLFSKSTKSMDADGLLLTYNNIRANFDIIKILLHINDLDEFAHEAIRETLVGMRQISVSRLSHETVLRQY